MFKKLFFLSCIVFLTGTHLYAQKSNSRSFRNSFEKKKAISYYDKGDNSTLKRTTKHRRFGKYSLEWKWNGKSYFGTSHFSLLNRKRSPLAYGKHFPASPTLVISLYNEKPQQDSIRISYKKKGREKVWFDIPLNFSGWRTVWVPFFEMSGSPPEKDHPVDYRYFKISSTSEKSSGTLFFDDIVFSQYMDDRHPYPDMMVPFIKRNIPLAERNHWMPLIKNMRRIRETKPGPVSDAELHAMARIENRLDKQVVNTGGTQNALSKAQKVYHKLSLTKTDYGVKGPPLTYKIKEVYFEGKNSYQGKYTDIRDFGATMRNLAIYYGDADKETKNKIESFFITGTKYYLDQGWQAGSSGGTRHHIGYGIRKLAEAFYIMKKPLERHHLLAEVRNSLAWLQNLGMVLGPTSEFHANIDYFNTLAIYQVMTIFLYENSQKRADLLKGYSNYLSVTLAQQGAKGMFKPDGTAWHHGGHYPAYAIGAFQKIPHVIYLLSGTPFEIDADGHRNFRKAFMAARLYSQLYNWGFGNAGRHPFGDNSIKSLEDEYLKMAYAGIPGDTAEIDRNMAAAWRRLWGDKEKEKSKTFKQKYGIKEEKLSGYYTFPYAATAVPRRDHWAAIIKGYSKYVWSSEIYVTENRYGRYPANGSIQLLNEGGRQGSGFNQDGWDWNRYPGTTVITLPFKELEPNTPLLMFRSNETFAGAAKLNGNGVFGVKLNESKGTNADGPATTVGFPGKLKANKSVFSFGDKLICIGTGLSSVDTLHPVQTNLFQNYLRDKKDAIYTSRDHKTVQFPYGLSMQGGYRSDNWIIDAYNNAYHILSPNKIEIRRQTQWSYNNHYSIRTGKVGSKIQGPKITKSNYATAWIDHGTAPRNASYQYVIYPFLDKNEIKNFPQKIKNDKTFTILRADNTAHIVRDNTTSTTGFVIFKADKSLDQSLLQSVSAPSILMIKRSDKKITVSAVQPDLNFKKDDDGKYIGYSYPVKFQFTLSGKWQLDKDNYPSVKSLNVINGQTVITMENRHGFSNIITLSKP